jgi:hypothetical protein
VGRDLRKLFSEQFTYRLFLPSVSSSKKGNLDHGRDKEKEGNTGNRYL